MRKPYQSPGRMKNSSYYIARSGNELTTSLNETKLHVKCSDIISSGAAKHQNRSVFERKHDTLHKCSPDGT